MTPELSAALTSLAHTVSGAIHIFTAGYAVRTLHKVCRGEISPLKRYINTGGSSIAHTGGLSKVVAKSK